MSRPDITNGNRFDRGGMTLLELVLVMVVICMMLAMVAPNLSGFFSSRQTSETVNNLIVLSRYASNQAISQGCRYRLNIDLDRRQYWLSKQAGSSFEQLDAGFGRVFTLPEGVEMTLDDCDRDGQVCRIDFTPTRTSGEHEIIVRDRKNNVFVLRNDSLTCPLRLIEKAVEDE